MSNVNKRLQSLARTHCAAFVGTDGCRYTPNGQSRCQWFRTDPQATPFLAVGGLRCGYFEKHVLPVDAAVRAAYWNTDELRNHNCKSCGIPFVKRSNRQTYCETCAAERKRERSRIGMVNGRASNKQNVNT